MCATCFRRFVVTVVTVAMLFAETATTGDCYTPVFEEKHYFSILKHIVFSRNIASYCYSSSES